MAADDAARIEQYLEHVRVEKRLAQRTVELYAGDLARLQAFAGEAGVASYHPPEVTIRPATWIGAPTAAVVDVADFLISVDRSTAALAS